MLTNFVGGRSGFLEAVGGFGDGRRLCRWLMVVSGGGRKVWRYREVLELARRSRDVDELCWGR